MDGSRRKLGVSLGVVDVIVTGAGGRLGRLLRAAWQEAPPEGLRPVWTGRGQGFDLAWDLLAGPVPDLPRGGVVLHLAGVLSGPEDALRRNAAMVAPLVAACRASGARRLLAVSSAAVYGAGLPGADEDDAPAPVSAYGRAKAEMESLALAAPGLAPNLAATVLRIGNVAGADALLGPRPAGQEIVLDAVQGRDDGPLRSWIGPRSLARVLAALCRLPALPPVLNIACDPPLAMADLLGASGLPWRQGPLNPATIPVATLSTRRLAALVDLPPADATTLAAEAAWARGVLA